MRLKKAMIGNFSDCKRLGSTMLLLLLLLLLIQQSYSLKPADELIIDRNKKPILYELTSREEMVRMAGYGEEKLSTVLITGSVLCQACLPLDPGSYASHHHQLRAWPISGALVGVNCQTASKNKSSSSQAEAVTDEFGDFLIDLPSHLHGLPNLQNICKVKVVRIPKKSKCQPAFVMKKHRGLKFSSVNANSGIRTYATGTIRFQDKTSKPLKACKRTQHPNA